MFFPLRVCHYLKLNYLFLFFFQIQRSFPHVLIFYLTFFLLYYFLFPVPLSLFYQVFPFLLSYFLVLETFLTLKEREKCCQIASTPAGLWQRRYYYNPFCNRQHLLLLPCRCWRASSKSRGFRPGDRDSEGVQWKQLLWYPLIEGYDGSKTYH